jgi:hypothetical protein
MPYISTETLIGGALLIVLAVGFQYLPKSTSQSKGSKKKNKKKSKGSVLEDEPSLKGQDGKKGKGKRKGVNRGIEGSGGVEVVEEKDDRPQVSMPLPTASTMDSKPKTLAEKIAPKPVKTKVDE